MTRKILVIVAMAGLLATLAWLRFDVPAGREPLVLHGNVDIRQVSLAFEGSARVVEMRVEEGDRVAAGEVLARLDTRSEQLELDRARAQVAIAGQTLLALQRGNRPEEKAQADAQVAAAQAELERSSLLRERLEQTAAATDGRAVSRQDLDDARAQERVARAELERLRQAQRLAHLGPRAEDIARAQAQLNAARADEALLRHRIALAQLRAPQAAVVRARLLEPGDMASPQRPAYTLALMTPKWVRAYVAEPQLGRIRPGMAVEVFTDDAPAQPLSGRVGFISSVAEFTPKAVETEDLRSSLVYEVRVRVEDAHDRLRLGMPATLRLPEGDGGGAR